MPRTPLGQRALLFWLAFSVIGAPTLASRFALADALFIRGDVDGDGARSMADVVVLAEAVVNRRQAELPCADAADFTDNGLVQLGDVALLLEHLIKGSPDVLTPVASPGEDPTEDSIGCERTGGAVPVEDLESGFSVRVRPAPGGAGHVRLEVALANSVPVVGGRAVYRIAGGLAPSSRVMERRPSLELLTRLPGGLLDDSVVEARVDEEGLVRLVWWVSMSGKGEPLDAGSTRALFDATLCVGNTPEGAYELEPISAELVTTAAERLLVNAEGARFSVSTSASECLVPDPTPREVRPYAWIEDASVQAGGTFRLSVYGTASWEYRELRLQFLWDRGLMRATGIEKFTPGGPGTIRGVLYNVLPQDADCGSDDRVFHVLIPSTDPVDPAHGAMKLCDPCCYGDDGSFGVITVWNYLWGVEPPRPSPADIEYHHYDIIFEVSPDAEPGVVSIPFFENPRTIGEGGVSDNAIKMCPDNCNLFTLFVQVRPLLDARIEILPASGEKPRFVRGDVDRDARVTLTDPVRLLNLLFGGLPTTFMCDDAADANDDGQVNVADGVYALNFLFGGGPPPQAPWPDAGDDPTVDGLDCER